MTVRHKFSADVLALIVRLGQATFRDPRWLLLTLTSAILAPQVAIAQAVNDPITNPDTGVTETIIYLINDDGGEPTYAYTNLGNTILIKTTVGDIIYSNAAKTTGQEVTAVTNGAFGVPASVDLEDITDNTITSTQNVLTETGGTVIPEVPPPASDPEQTINNANPGDVVEIIRTGADGSNGGNAYGFRACIPFTDICATVGVDADPGGSGATPSPLVETVEESHGLITSSANNTPAITIGSIGGDGGDGGDAAIALGLDGAPGGRGGAGGNVTATNRTDANVSGTNSYGFHVFSLSGNGGDGGNCIVALNCQAGAGGGSNTGGTVIARNDPSASLTTNGSGAHGIYAFSSGGSGGNGGTGWGIIGEAGSGATGGNGGSVSVFHHGDIYTRGNSSHGILAQSIGGTGGNAGTFIGVVAFGSSGGAGGTGGTVRVETSVGSSITTEGTYSVGIAAQSIGGGGGDSGTSGGIISLGSTGVGGSGSSAGRVTVINRGRIETLGQLSHGILAQSIGGGGGSSGVSGGVVSLGGSGGSGGGADTVEVTNESTGVIVTAGQGARGIFAQSIGGGGGAAGTTGGLVSLGSPGGSGSSGGQVTVTNNGFIGTGLNVSTNPAGVATFAAGADAIFAQSIGGGGGAASGSWGLVALNPTLGGGGNGGGNAGGVSVTNNGTLRTTGDFSRGIFAQSVGGGGGAGGNSGGLVAIGGTGSSAGNGGDVTVTTGTNSAIATQGLGSTGIFAQSVGGGGGTGGASGGAIAIGGGGAGGGDAGRVTVNAKGSILTAGDRATGIFAQSVGGGGGDGATSGGIVSVGGSGGAGSDANTVNVTHGGIIQTGGDDSLGIFAQSVGGGGGNGGSSYSGGLFAGFSLGGSGSSGGEGGNVTVDLDTFVSSGITTPARISTEGDRATGILAQSVGGGGGNGGNSVQGTVGTGVSLSVAIGGSGGSGGEGGIVNITGTGNVFTKGNNASGVVLQSVGGGGGNGGTTVSASASIGDGVGIAVAIGGSGGDGGDGGEVTANVTSNIETEGAFSNGFVAQSIGGGGGNGGTTIAASAAIGVVGAGGISVGVGGDGGNAGDGDTVDVTLNGSVRTEDIQSDGIIVQSIGGGGGNGGLTLAASATGAGGTAGNITVGVGAGGGDGGKADRVDAVINADVTTLGDGSDGVVIQTIGGGGGNSGLTISAGVSGGGAGAGGINVGVGAAGGGGGDGDIIDGEYHGDLVTEGDQATGLLVQSIGGGGGNSGGTIAASLNGGGAGAGSVSVGIGGAGGGAGDGGRAGVDRAITLETSGSVTTGGSYSSGIVAQSLGGGGGNGGYSISAAIAGGGVGSGAVSVGVGGSAGGGGQGKDIYARLNSEVVTGLRLVDLDGLLQASSGVTDSHGILVQSIGGGGGNGGFNVSVAGAGAGIGAGALSVGLGGSGGGGGAAGAVDVASTGQIYTFGDRSSGLTAQSIGGGGGNGGFNVSVSGAGAGKGAGAVGIGVGGSGAVGGVSDMVIAKQFANIFTAGNESKGFVAQSIGGGGGNGGFNLTATGSGAGIGSGSLGVGIGGFGGGGGRSGSVAATMVGSITTLGDDATAMIAQSVGGGGGNGGFSINVNGSGAGVGSGSLGVGIGGFGGDGGQADAVTVTATSTISTRGDRSEGMFAQSLGGGGGNGGFNITATGDGAGVGSGALGVGIGGFGGAGGNASTVTVTSWTGNITTVGADATAFTAQSLGGGGGNGGFNITAVGAGAGTGSGAVGVGIGGFGGGGGQAAAVTVTTATSTISTTGDRSEGVVAQSLGGGGGNGGFNINVNGSGAGVGSGALGVGIGGFGGGGGNAGSVTVGSWTGDITTRGADSTAFTAQSLGGGGGNGGFNFSVTGSGAGVGAGAANVGIGGFGGGGGFASTVTAKATSNISTAGDRSGGLLAQSLGGGGGNGGFNFALSGAGAGTGAGTGNFGLGGFGGGGGVADTVDATLIGDIATQGVESTGFAAQSIGGGGGNGGFNFSVTGSGAGVGAGSGNIGIGGFGGDGGDAGAVIAKATSSISTQGDRSGGFLAQSLGGGGGNGAFNFTITGTGAGTGAGGVSFGLGGFGGGGGNASTVTATVDGTGKNITTLGQDATGFTAQSLGGGGGNGGFNFAVSGSGAGTGSGALSLGLGGFGGGGGDAANVTASVSANISTRGDRSGGFLAQSLGGGGGNGGFNFSAAGSGAGTGSGAVSLGLGGFGGGGGFAGGVTATMTGAIATLGADAVGFAAQSIGGGGGNGGFNVNIAGSGGGTGSGALSLGLGGSGGDGGAGGSVTAKTTSSINTEGDRSGGFLAQSLGGGGGNGGFNVNIAGSGAGTGSGAVSLGLGGFGGDGGNASFVNATSEGAIATTGNNAVGLTAQSIGGGGGNGGFNVTLSGSGAGTGSGALSVGLGGFGGGGGDADDVDVTTSADISTGGDRSGGILAQSIGGGGGNGGFNVTVAGSGGREGSGAVSVGIGGFGGDGGDAGDVTLDITNNVTSTGFESTGITGQSLGGGGGNGGFNISAALSGASTGSGALGVGVGGSGGGGGSAGDVTATIEGNISSVVSSADPGKGGGGVLLQSLGGGGGNGGFNLTGALSFAQTGSGAVGIGVGGMGGGGGDAGNVSSNLTGNVTATKDGGFGVTAQSIGGGGGNGGLNISGTISAAKEGAGALGVGIGGMGGAGGDAGTVTNAVTGNVLTTGKDANGVFAQSLGGGGGNGGVNVTGSVSASVKMSSGNLGVGVGGFGGSGGDAGAVINNVTGDVDTFGDSSDAIIAQSLGGGGGNGGTNVTGSLNLSKENGGAVGIGVGGFGGDGGDGSTVNSTVVTNGAIISTAGANSSGVVAQSLGGGGGNGGVNVTAAVNITGKSGAAIAVGVGGFGGGGGVSDDVTVNVTGEIQTQKSGSHGLLAQSIAGGGGNGGTNVSGTLAFTNAVGNSTAVASSIGVGGFGGAGGNAGDVDVTYSGKINVASTVNPDDEGAHGIAAQSIGGGGGNGAVNVSAGLSFTSSTTTGDAYGLMFGIGGFGGDGGNAGAVNVNVNNTESITAKGQDRAAILAQSLGGGGGNGGLNVTAGVTSDSSLLIGIGGLGANAGTASTVSVRATTDLFAYSDNDAEAQNTAAGGIVAQSIGGGGGNGGMNVTGGITIAKENNLPSVNVGIGGFGGDGAASDDVTVTHTGNITSVGNWTHGVLAQSLAGGGGNGGMNVSGQLNWADSTSSGGKTDLTIVAGIGGKGGGAADAGDVTVTQDGIITTSGDHARGIFAQSIGGGGGTGGMNITGVFAKNSSPIQVGIGGSGGDAGNAGAVTVNRGSAAAAAGSISTDGEAAHGIEASSIGGGGGDAGINFNAGISTIGRNPKESGSAVQIAIGGSGGDSSDSSTVAVNNYSTIATLQDNSHGILAQSIGGGGGNANINHSFTYANATAGKKENKNLGFSFALGGAVGDGGNADRVDVVHVGDIQTSGRNSFGVFAQSLGGGGGNADNETESTFLDLLTGAADGLDVGGPNVSISIGRRGGTGGDGSDVSLSSDGAIATLGKGSHGLFAQSIGGGGGNSTTSSISASDGNDNSVEISIGIKGATGGRSGDVEVDAKGSVMTQGEQAHGIFAQSVGGGGGSGGSDSDFCDPENDDGECDNSEAFGISDVKDGFDTLTGDGAGTSVSIILGGEGGDGGVSGDVTVDNAATINTKGDRAVGILAQSVGGGGGEGGVAQSGYISSGSTINMTLGGKGGTGNDAGDVAVTNSSAIATDGETAHGIFAQSLGGGGGNGGMAINATLLNVSQGGFNVSAGIGGSAGGAGNAGTVEVTNTGTIQTIQKNSFGIFAQSIGGGGGNGGKAIAGTLISSQENRFALTVGGQGGAGGTGNNVTVTNNGSILTQGEKSHGILAQSVGGGGGTGGMSIIADLALGTTPGQGFAGNFAIGGQGGSGNTAGDVTVTNTGVIDVSGDGAYGIYAQSVGGGGGDGGFAASFSTSALSPDPATAIANSLLTFAMGGFGGTGADSGDVTVNHSGSITARGDNAYGIFAQSVGGGGGKSSYSLSLSPWMIADAILKTVVGGGSNGTPGKVTVNTTGNITMLGENSQAIHTQQLNGGGGTTDIFLDFSQFGTETIEVAAEFDTEVQVGSEGTTNAAGGEVESTHTGNLATVANNAIGSLIQSIGAGGGKVVQQIKVALDSVTSIDARLGALNSNNSGGGEILTTREGEISTLGSHSIASAIQSIGGGGGNLRLAVQTVDGAGNDVSQTNSLAKGSVILGSDPSLSNPGGDVTLEYDGDTSTTGDYSPNFVVQSIGGGGGTAFLSGLASATVELGASDLSSGNGGDITFTNEGNIATAGLLSHGAVIQSIGGGGGFVLSGIDTENPVIKNDKGEISSTVGADDSLVINLSTDNIGNGGNILFQQTGDVSIGGDRAFGIFAQSVGGGGGLVDDHFADTAGGKGSSGTVTILLEGNLAATGQDNVGIFAQSRSPETQGNITIDLADDKTIWMNDTGIGVKISGGTDNTFTNNGGFVIATAEAAPTSIPGVMMVVPDGYTVVGEEGNETVLNKATGVFYGNMNLGGGVNSFTSELGASVFTGAEMFIGGDTQSTFTVAGIISPGDQGIYTTEIAGNYVQTASADFDLNLDFTDDSLDRLNITQDASLEGDLNVFSRGIGKIKPGQRNLIFAATDPNNAASEITKETLNLVIPPSAIATYEIGSTNKIAYLDVDVDFAGFGILNRNQTSFGNYLNRVQLAGSDPRIAPLIEAIFALPESEMLRKPYDSLSPELYGIIHANLRQASSQLRDDLYSCRSTDSERDLFMEGECVWLDISGYGHDAERNYENFGFKTTMSNVSGGMQLALGEDWYLGVAGSSSVYENTSSQPANLGGSSNQAGMSLKKGFGATKIGFSLVGGSGEFDGERAALFPIDGRVTSEQDASFFGSWLRISHDISPSDGWYIRPMLDFGSTRVKVKGFQEEGADFLNLVVSDSSQAYVSVNPALEIGGEFQNGNLTIRPMIYLGYTHYLTDPSPSTFARLEGAPQGVDAFEVESLGDRNMFDAAANLELQFINGISMNLGYWGQFSKNTTSHGGEFKLKYSF